MKKTNDVLEFPTTVQMTKVDDDCVLNFGDRSIVLSYDAAFELAIQLSTFVQQCDEEEAGDLPLELAPSRHLELVVH